MKNTLKYLLILFLTVLISCNEDEYEDKNYVEMNIPIEDIHGYWFQKMDNVKVGDIFATIYISEVTDNYHKGLSITLFKKVSETTNPYITLISKEYESYYAYKNDTEILFKDRVSGEVIIAINELNTNSDPDICLIRYSYDGEQYTYSHYRKEFLEL